jgi:hypothetical protein
VPLRQAVDSRDLDGLVECFVPDVQVGRGTFGRPALRDWFDGVLRTFGISIHFIGNHRISIVDDDRASGVVYCRAEHEVGDEWVVMMIKYWDDYARIDGEWLISAAQGEGLVRRPAIARRQRGRDGPLARPRAEGRRIAGGVAELAGVLGQDDRSVRRQPTVTI